VISTYILFWLILLVIAVSNGFVREATYGRKLTELHAHQLSTVTGMLFSGVAVWGFSRFVPIESERSAIFIGAIWLGLTVAFEFLFGRLVGGYSWRKLVFDYNLLAGRVWLVFLLWLLLLPYIVYLTGTRAT
jgi:hypothetical protein